MKNSLTMKQQMLSPHANRFDNASRHSCQSNTRIKFFTVKSNTLNGTSNAGRADMSMLTDAKAGIN